MKKILPLFAVMLTLSLTAAAQADLQLLSSLRSTDTIHFNSGGTIGRIILTGFVNNGPQALTSSDTIRWRSPIFTNTVSLRLPAAGLPANDTVYYLDTIFLNSMPTPNPFPWCDSIWAKASNNAIIADPNTANNKVCHTVRFIQVSNTGVGSVAGTEGQELSVYPNPASDKLQFSFDFGSSTSASLKLRDLLGKTILEQDLGRNLSGKQTKSLDLTNVPNGMYFLELHADGYTVTRRVIVQK